MRIHRVSIRNFRGVVACDVELSSTGVTIIEGPNEVGKSSLAEAVDLLFDYPHDSRHRNVLAVRPVHRDAGPEVEVELTTGPYSVVYAKRWFRQPETRLAVRTPAVESLVARTAHDRMEAILEETLDRNLYRALRFVQGDRIAQGFVGTSTTLIGALDQAAAGGAADPEAESTLWQAIQDERARYFTPNGKVSQERERLATRLDKARAEAQDADIALAELEEAGEQYRATVARLHELRNAEDDAAKELDEARSLRDALVALELNIETLKAQAGEAELAEANAELAQRTRSETVRSLESIKEELGRLGGLLETEEPLLSAAEDELQDAGSALEGAKSSRESALSALALSEADHEFRRAEISDRLLTGRLGRIKRARAQETEARQFLDTCKVTKQARSPLEKAVRRVIEARAARDVGSPSVAVEALAEVDLTVDDAPVHLSAGNTHGVAVTADTTIGIEDRVLLHVQSGGSTGDLQAELTEAEQEVARLVHRYGLDQADPITDLANVLDKRRDAETRIETAQQTKADALEDLTEEELAAKAENAREVIENYPGSRSMEPPLPGTVEEAERALATARQQQRDTERLERERRAVVDTARETVNKRRVTVSTTRELLRRQAEARTEAEADLAEALAQKSGEDLEASLTEARTIADQVRKMRDQAIADFHGRDPDSVRLRLENAGKRIERLEREQRSLDQQRIELETTLRVKGAADLQASIDSAESIAGQLGREHQELERRAAAAWRLHETFARHRDAARLAYVAPYKEQVDKLARLVFGSDTSIEVDPQDFTLTARSLGGVAVPFDSLSTGAREQLAVLARLACAILVNPEAAAGDAGVPVILDDALGYSDPDRLRRLAPAFTAAAKQAQVIVMTSTPDRYGRVGDAKVIRLSTSP